MVAFQERLQNATVYSDQGTMTSPGSGFRVKASLTVKGQNR